MGGPEDFLVQGHDLAEAGNSFVILALAVLRIGETVPASEGISMLGAGAALPAFDYRAQDVLSFAIGALVDQQVADGILHVSPLLRVTFATGQLFRGAEIFHGGLELDPFLRGETGQLVGLDDLSRFRRTGLLRFFG